MKYALCVLALITTIFASFPQPSFAVTITSFNDSPAIMNVIEFIKDSASDLKVSNLISEKKLKVTDLSKCTEVKAVAVLAEIETAIHNVLRYYPDEELPLDDAYNDLITLLGSHTYKKCTFTFADEKKKIKTNYFFNESGSVHIKVDTITLLAQ